MKFAIQAQVTTRVERTVEADSLEEALAKARRMKRADFFYYASGTAAWPREEHIKILGATDPKVTK